MQVSKYTKLSQKQVRETGFPKTVVRLSGSAVHVHRSTAMKSRRPSLSERAIVLFSISLLFFSNGCPTPTDPIEPECESLGATVKPGVGSTYSFNFYDLDDNGNREGAGRPATLTVQAHNVSIGGRTGAVKFVNTDSRGSDSAFLIYEANGDVSFYDRWMVENNGVRDAEVRFWTRSPMQSNQTLSGELDTIVLGGGRQYRFKLAWAFSSLGDTCVMVGSQRIAGRILENVIVSQVFEDGIRKDSSVNTTRAIGAPTIGYSTAFKTPNRIEAALTAYNLVDPIPGKIIPGVGSTYTSAGYNLDPVTGARIESSKKTNTYTLAAHNISFGGRNEYIVCVE
jgi:hypothetical protein